MSDAFFLVGVVIIIFGYLQYRVSYGLPRGLMVLLWVVFALKIVVATTMGHYDIYRFIVFIQHFIATPTHNPWSYSLANPAADFPYPPLLLYIHTIFFLPFHSVLNLNNPFLPNAFGYTLIRLPFLLADWLLLKTLLDKYRTDRKLLPLLFYLLSGVILFHQYYSGQFDLIAVVPFFLAVQSLEKNGPNLKSGLLLALSLILKPFGLLFYPFLLLKGWRSKQKFYWISLLVMSVALYKISELPYSLTTSYQKVVGAGAGDLLSPGMLSHTALFPTVYVLLVVFYGYLTFIARKNWSVNRAIVLVVLAMAAFAPHSAGWMTWAVPFAAIELTSFRQNRLELGVWLLWNISFIARWALVSHGPLLDSFSVLTDQFLGKNLQLPLGAPYIWITRHYSINRADYFQNQSALTFAYVSLGLFLVRLFAVIVPSKHQS